ncbi:MAG: hypothetical protein QOG60_2492 [Frankiaceae bacterium]|jgi:nitrite reductase/ring-hydroxylating ferredoxin subunit/uncharacterized membrane protein|nr:hypothetical protein [Frankiaceae bacterium]
MPIPDAAVERIEGTEALDQPAELLAGVLNKVIPPGPVKDLLSGTALGHPAHPMLVTVPIGAWTAVSVLDFFGGKGAHDAARKLVAFGALAALPTAATGASDWADTMGAERRIGLVHAVGNYAALGVYGLSYLARRKHQHGKGKVLALIGVGLLSATGYLGGHLSYAYGVGVDTTAFQGAPEDWSDVAAENDVVEGQAQQVDLGGVPVLLTRSADRVVAIFDRCTHRGAPLHEGRIENGCVECPWHGSLFRLADGEIERGPASRPQPRLEVKIVGGRVQLRRTEARALRSNPV